MLKGLCVLGSIASFGVVAMAQTPPPAAPAGTQAVPTPIKPGMPLQPEQGNPALPTLTLDQALGMARTKNGDVTAEKFNAKASGAAVQQAYGAFFPTLTPQYQYSDERITGNSNRVFTSTTSGSTSNVLAKWEVLDTGERQYNFLSARRSYQAEQMTFAQTVRQTLFNVDQDYFNTLRAQELEKVAAAQAQRANTILDQTQAQVQVGDAPQKDVLQARADYLNARVQELTDKNATIAAEATLKSIIGWDSNESLPTLQTFPEPGDVKMNETLDQSVTEGLRDRPDLRSIRYQIESRHYQSLFAQTEAGVTFSLNTQYNAIFTPGAVQDRLLNFQVSFPLFDGNVLRERYRQADYEEKSLKASLVQRERDARAEIETAYNTLSQDVQRVQAAKLAVDAAQLNYQSESEAQKLGAQNSTVVTVLTAQVSLVTAESAYIQAIYDYYIADADLRLVTGKPMPGEAA
jgi:outer membrane protein